MTWLPIDERSRDAVLSLKPEPYAALRETFAAARHDVDQSLLELCRGRVAAAVGLVGSPPEPQSELERAAVEYAEQFHYDHNGISESQRDAVARHFSGDLSAFVRGVWLEDAYARVAAVLELEPEPPAPLGSGTQGLAAAIGAFGRTVITHSDVDDVTTEALRLRNAHHQHCLY